MNIAGTSCPELRYVKVLFCRQELRSCIAVGEALVKQLSCIDGDTLHVHRAYIHFYLALAEEDMARQMYDLSRYKMAHFENAEQHYHDAEAALIAFQYRERPPQLDETPVRQRRGLPRDRSSYALFASPPTPASMCSDSSEELSSWQIDCVQHELRAMHKCISTMMDLLAIAKAKAAAAHANREAAQTPVRTGASHENHILFPMSTGKKMQATKSFWLFTPDTTKSSDKQKRIEAGRQRGWKRERFQPGRYNLLAERALAEL